MPTPAPPPTRRLRLYPTLLLLLLAAILLGQYRSHHPHIAAPSIAIAPPAYAATPLHFSSHQLSLADFLVQLSRQSPVPVAALWSGSPPTALAFSETDFPLADLPTLLDQLPDLHCTAVFESDRLVLGDPTAIYDPARAVTTAYPVSDLISPSFFSDDELWEGQLEFQRVIQALIATNTWADNGGTLSTTSWHDTTFFATTSPDIQFKIQSLLAAIRRL